MGPVSDSFSYFSFLTYTHDDRSIESQAQANFSRCLSETTRSLATQHISPLAPRPSSPHIKGRSSSPPLPPLPRSVSLSSEPEYNSNEQQIGVDLEGLMQSGDCALKVTGLRKDYNDTSKSTLDLRLKVNATLAEIIVAIKDAGASLTILPMLYLHV